MDEKSIPLQGESMKLGLSLKSGEYRMIDAGSISLNLKQNEYLHISTSEQTIDISLDQIESFTFPETDNPEFDDDEILKLDIDTHRAELTIFGVSFSCNYWCELDINMIVNKKIRHLFEIFERYCPDHNNIDHIKLYLLHNPGLWSEFHVLITANHYEHNSVQKLAKYLQKLKRLTDKSYRKFWKWEQDPEISLLNTHSEKLVINLVAPHPDLIKEFICVRNLYDYTVE